MRSVKVALVQMRVTEDKERNLRSAADAVRRAAAAGAQVVCLPEMFVCPYEHRAFLAAREARGGRIWSALAQMAAESRVVLIGGSFPEAAEGRLYNTCFVFDAAGRQIARIQTLAGAGRLRGLPDTLRETAEARLAHPDATLSELAALLKVGKSGINHRLRKLEKLAADLIEGE